ncbi:MAG: OsmC family protein [Bacteroidetes bacterium]|jgi:putative redox protein|nr:OsmC family protein [Bacteroidota bacterium]MBK8328952.1 OsmC family protein [Bacteroidota bacterium]MBK9302301.1 OsmC family protein [Bacteroidota bacterium]MBK9480420.1 OsmC family protein [Bacteroidota bacterium]HQW45935.1 OsmC family protein [Chitinophagaceae bacterium]
MTAQIIYLGDLRTQATHLQSQTIIDTDAPKDNQGKGERFSPTDLVATALGSCMLSIMGIAANTHSMDIVETSIDIEKIMVADPLRRIGEIKVDIHFPSTKTYTDKEKKILERAALTCPVYLSLNENVQKTVTFNWP